MKRTSINRSNFLCRMNDANWWRIALVFILTMGAKYVVGGFLFLFAINGGLLDGGEHHVSSL